MIYLFNFLFNIIFLMEGGVSLECAALFSHFKQCPKQHFTILNEYCQNPRTQYLHRDCLKA